MHFGSKVNYNKLVKFDYAFSVSDVMACNKEIAQTWPIYTEFVKAHSDANLQ